MDARTEHTPAADSWRLMGLSFVGSGALGLLSLPFATGPEFNAPLLAGLCLLAAVAGLLSVWRAAFLPERLLIVGLLACVGLVSLAVAVTDGPGSPYVLFYAWIGVEASYFLSRHAAVPFTVVAGAASAVTLQLSADPGDVPIATWVMVVGTMLAVGVLTAALRKRSDDLIEMLADRATRDSLTGLANRRGYHERIERELERARRHDLPLSIVLADIDDFKSLNDEFGHAWATRRWRFAALVTSELRGADMVSRVGGKEFAIVLPHVDERGALVHRRAAAARRPRRPGRARRPQPVGVVRRARSLSTGEIPRCCSITPTRRCTPPSTWAATARSSSPTACSSRCARRRRRAAPGGARAGRGARPARQRHGGALADGRQPVRGHRRGAGPAR